MRCSPLTLALLLLAAEKARAIDVPVALKPVEFRVPPHLGLALDIAGPLVASTSALSPSSRVVVVATITTNSQTSVFQVRHTRVPFGIVPAVWKLSRDAPYSLDVPGPADALRVSWLPADPAWEATAPRVVRFSLAAP